MKKPVAILLVTTLMATALVGCKKDTIKEEVQEKPTVETTEEPSQEETVTEEAPTFAYTSVKYDDDYEYFSGVINCVEITDSKHEKLAEAVNAYFSNKVKEFNTTCETLVKEAKETNQSLMQDQQENAGAEDEYVYDYVAYYDYDIYVDVIRADSQMFSIKVEEYTYTAGAHGGTVDYGVTFDTQTGKIIEKDSLGDIADIVKTAILNDIDKSTDATKDLLFPEYKDTIEDIFKNGMDDVNYWFNDRGIVVAFQQYDIAPYAAGIITFNVPYDELKGFDEKYIPQTEFYSTTFSEQGFADLVDVNSDGTKEVVYLETVTDEENFASSFTLHIDDQTITLDEVETFTCAARFVHSSTGDYIILQTTGMDDWNIIFFYDVAKNYSLIQQMDGFIDSISDGKAVIGKRVDAFGTWTAKKDYTYDGNGFYTTAKEDIFDNDPRTNANAKGITALKEVKYTDDDGEEQKLKKGTVIYPISTDGSTLKFVNEDGSISGSFKYETKDYERFIDGVSEYQLFEDMPYAG